MATKRNYRKEVFKTCVNCEETFLVKTSVQRFCTPRCKGQWKYTSRKTTTQSQYLEISGNWSRYLSRLIYSGGTKRVDLSTHELLSILEAQDGLCALSGLPLTCQLEKGVKFPFNASVDRVIAGGPYTQDNIQLVCNCLNKWRSDTTVEDFIAICTTVADYHRKKGSEGGL